MLKKAEDYQIGVKRLITVPFLLTLVICLAIYTLADLYHQIELEVRQANNINYLLAQSAAVNNAKLITKEVNTLLTDMPQYESITFFPFSQQQSASTHPITLSHVFIERYYGLSQPVSVTLSDSPTDRHSQVSQLIGYINLTLDLTYIRHQWLKQHIALFVIMSLISLSGLWFILSRIQRLTNRLPTLEALSQHILKDKFDDIASYPLPRDENAWVFEKALLYLLNQRKARIAQLETMSQEKAIIQEAHIKQIEQSSKFENILIHEFKSSVNRIESGLQLLQNQYISAHQKDAVEIIRLGKDDLNAKLDQIIQIHRIEKGLTGVSAYQFCPRSLIAQIAAQYQPLAAHKKLTLTVKHYHADYVLEGDIQKITLVISSLVENAIKFTEQGSVTITSQLQHLQSQIRWTLQIADTGPGIAQAYLDRIFEPFFQVNPEIKHTASHNTAGLFLVKKLVTLMKGEISVTSEPDKGSVFQVALLLKDWKNHFQRNLLMGKHIAVWYQYEDLIDKAKRLTNAGAHVESFTNTDLLKDYLLSHDVDALVISRYVNYKHILAFVSAFRKLESTSRVIIICVYDVTTISPYYLERLKMAGIDYFIKQDQIDEKPEHFLKNLSNLLN